MTAAPPSAGAIHLQPVGEGVSLEFLDEIAARLARAFRVSCHVRTSRLDPQFALDAVRGQYHATAILADLARSVAGGEGVRVVGVTELDLFIPVLTYVFGEAQLGGPAGVVSSHRLREEFYGMPARPEILLERSVKEAIHELGHTFGLKHCPDWRCVMASTHAVERLDLKSAEFCAVCRRAIS